MSHELVVLSPIDGSEYARRHFATESMIDSALANAKSAQKSWAAMPLADRLAVVGQAVDRVVEKKQLLAEAITHQMGRPIRFCPGEVDGFAARARHMLGIAEEALGVVQVPQQPGFTRFITREPVGVVLTIAPWNYPLLTAVNSIVPALLAGNAVILKHSEQTPLCAELLYRAFDEAGIPKGVFQYLHVDHESLGRMIRAEEINFVCFTGSVRVGRLIEQAAAGRFIGVGLELGGNDPAYVRSDSNLAHAVETLVDGAFFNSGQSCCGIQRIYVARALYDDFVEQSVALTNQYILGNPLDMQTTLGPLVTAAAAEGVRGVIADAIAKGAKNLIDERRFERSRAGTPYLAPSIIVHVNHGMSLMNEECFGPTVGIMPVDGDEDAIRLMNDSPYGLTASVFTGNAEAAMHIGQQLEAGTVFMNRCDYLDPALAWTGIKNSGRGATLSTIGFEHLTRPKSFHLKTTI
jgi:acyl-CoA reductase-like NAD-dependent aldehyde dehydrogenase